MHKIINAVAITGVVCLLAAAGFGVWVLRQSSELTHDSDAVWRVAEMVIEHLKANGDEWPHGWEDLRDDYQICVKRYDPPWSFEEIQERVCVDWSATSDLLLKSASENSRPNFKVIWLSDGRSVHWQGAEPNQIIFNHFSARIANQPAVSTMSEI